MTAAPPRVRAAEAADRDELWPLARDFATSFRPERGAFDTTFHALLERQDDTLLAVAEGADGALVGYVLASSHPTFLANGPVAWVEEVMVREDQRHAGVGTLLMRAAERWARSKGTAYVALASRRAGDFYTALGYDASATFFRKTEPGTR